MRMLLNNIKKSKTCYLFIFPFFALFFLFVVLPVGISVVLSIFDYNLLQTPKFVGFENYAVLFFKDNIFMKSIINSFTMALVVGPVSYIGALVLAWALNELTRGLRTAMVFLIYAPSISGNAFMIWQLLFSGDQLGYINSLLIRFGIVNSPIQFLTDTKYMMTVVIIVTLWTSMGTQFLSFVAGLQGIDQSLYEAGAIDGIRNRWQELWFITIPQIKPQLVFGSVISITGAFTVGGVGALLCGNPSTDYAVHTMVNHMEDLANVKFEFGDACAIATILFVMMLSCNALIKRLLRNIGE